MPSLFSATPAVEAAQLPPLRSLNKEGVFCLQKTPLVLPLQGAPVVFSTDIAHDFVLHLNWQPLATLVRIPSLEEVRCPESPGKQCSLAGSSLFLLDSVASGPQFTHTVSVPIGFADTSLKVPRPNGTLLYIKLRDDPNTVNTLTLPVLPGEE